MSQKTSTNKKKLLLAVLLLVSMVTQFIGYPNQADAIVPYSQEFKSFGGPEDPIIVMKDGVAASKKIDEARANNTLYISSINTPFHTYAPKGVRYGEFKGWDGKIRKEKITLNSIHKMKFIIPVPRNTTILGTTAIFNVEGEVLPPEEILVPERWVSFPESGVSLPWIKASYQKNQCQLNSNVNTSVGAANPYLSLLETKDKTTSPGYYLEGDTIIFNAYLRFTTFTDSQSGVKGADNITEELKDLRDRYLRVEKLKRLGDPDYAKRKAEIEALIADYHLKVGDDAFRIQEPFIRTGKMASNSLLEGQYTYYTNPGVYFTPNDYCPSHVHKYFYTKTGDTERLDNYKTEAYDQKSGYEIKHEDGYSVVSWHTITDETKCKEEPGLVDYDIALKKFNNNAKGKEAAKLSSDTTLRPAPKGSEIAIKLIREENIPEVQDKETILEITQKRISKHFDLSPWGSKESPPVVLTYTWPSVPGCVCLKCNPGPGECTEYCYSTVEPSMTFIIDQINKTRNDLLAEVEYFLSYFENDSNYEMVSRGDEAGQHEMKPNYHYILWRGKDVPILASYKYRTKEAQEQAAPLYKHLIDAMNHKPVHPRYGLNDPNYDKEENKGIIYEDQLTLTFGGVPNYSYLEEDLQTTAMRGSCSDPVYANQKASRPVPQNLHAKVLVHCYHGLPNNGI